MKPFPAIFARRNLCPVRKRLLLLSGLATVASTQADAGSTWGGATNVAVNASGVYIKPAGGLPADCATSTNGWLLIPASNSAMIAEFMSRSAQNQPVLLVTDNSRNEAGYCYIIWIYEKIP